MKHQHLRAVPDHLLGVQSRLLRPDLSVEYIQGVIDGSLLAYSTASVCLECAKALQGLNARVDSLQVFMEETGLGGPAPPF